MSRMFKATYRFTRIRRFWYIFLCMVPIAQLFGVFTHLFELDYDTAFFWPLDADIKNCVRTLRTEGRTDCPIINYYNYSYLFGCEKKCQTESSEPLMLVIVVKSKLDHFKRRSAIRKSWGSENGFSDLSIRTVFLLGVKEKMLDLQMKIEQESKIYGDIIQTDFIDSYWNNTIKTMMGMRWVYKFCNNSKFYVFCDDDYYISTKNVLRFVENPFNYPENLQTPISILQKGKRGKGAFDHQTYSKFNKSEHSLNDPTRSVTPQSVQQAPDCDLSGGDQFYAGCMTFRPPERSYFNKWYVLLSEYPFNKWPPYITAGCYILSLNALTDLYFGSFFTKHFRMDDNYLGFVAKKMDLDLFHSDEFYYFKKPYDRFSYRHVIASHGYGDPHELLRVWNEQKSAGNA